jgi:hypothetical protein
LQERIYRLNQYVHLLQSQLHQRQTA